MSSLTKGWCPSLEKPMETGDGLLVRLPIKFGRANSDMVRSIAKLATSYGNGHLDLSARGNLQIRGVTQETYAPLRQELKQLGLEKDFVLNIIVSPFADEKTIQLADELTILAAEFSKIPEKYLIVIDDDGIFPLSALPCDLYIDAKKANVENILATLSIAKQCDKKTHGTQQSPLGVVKHSTIIAAPFGRMEVEQMEKLADIADKYSASEILFAPFRRVILPNINNEAVLQDLEVAGFITKNSDARLAIHACVGAPACSSGLGETRAFAEKYALDNPNLKQIVHISGCAKGCAYKGKADITIIATKKGYDIHYAEI